ncbi:MAG: RNA methyltransferase, partial [Gemmatimonadota bacterium]
LRTRKNREASGRFLAEGIRVVEALVDSGLRTRWVLTSSSLTDSRRGEALMAEVTRRGIPVRTVADELFASFAATEKPQGVIAVAEIPESSRRPFEAPPSRAVVLVLDAVQDPGNFGTLVRSAEALGAVGIVSLAGTVDPWNPKAVRAAAGSSFHVPILQERWHAASSMLREAGYAIVGASVDGLPAAELRERRVALVVGNEGAGLSNEVRDSLDHSIGVPLRGRAESLNVAAAAAILLYELTR